LFEGNYIEKKVKFIDEIDSTNNFAMELIQNNAAEEGHIVSTNYQINGKGQVGAKWESDKAQNILLSIILKPLTLPALDNFHLNRFVSVAIMEFISETISTNTTIKWPNDIMVGNEKIGGILIENIIKQNNIYWSVLGIGINVNQLIFNNTFQPKATSLKRITSQDYNIKELTSSLFEKIISWYRTIQLRKYDLVSQIYTENMYRINVPSSFKTLDFEFEGTIEGVRDDGKLMIRNSDGEIQTFTNKEITFNF